MQNKTVLLDQLGSTGRQNKLGLSVDTSEHVLPFKMYIIRATSMGLVTTYKHVGVGVI